MLNAPSKLLYYFMVAVLAVTHSGA